MLRKLELVMVRGNRTLCQFDRLKKFRCVRTIATPNFVLTRRTCEAAAKPPHASRSSGFVSNSRPRHREGSSSGNIGFCNSVRSGGIRRRPLPRSARFEDNARLKFSREAQKSMSRPNSPHKLTKPPSLGSAAEPPWAAPTARARHVGCQFAPVTAC